MKIEMLYPEVANLHGDNYNITYLSQCRPDATIIRTALTDTPAFTTTPIGLIYLGPMTESGQTKVIHRLFPHKDRINELIHTGTIFLFTHNAFEILGERIDNLSLNQTTPGLGILPITTKIDLLNRYTGKVLGTFPGISDPIVGHKSQFSMVQTHHFVPEFLTLDKGIGRDRNTQVEGVHLNNFFGTSLLGPLLINNPHFTTYLLHQLDPNTPPHLPFKDLAQSAYQSRLTDFQTPSRWHPWETPRL